MNKRRWAVICTAKDGRVIGRRTYWTRWGAERAADIDRKTASGAHLWMTDLPARLGPLFDVHIERTR